MRVEVLVLSITAGAIAELAAPGGAPCRTGVNEVVVLTGSRTLLLCEGGRAHRQYTVALGSNGVGKQREGDRRTPLGAYALGAPRRSWSYGVFVPVAYPTETQARAGLTGGAIGIHGPPRAFVGAGLLNTATDWTAGCIAVGSDREIGEIAAWIRAQKHPAVRIE